ncbi:MAG: hypothetical protein CME06_13165 [Gemmatimonadetes bacterium]|nr:hypothetical protein [Gemmatimonadota bacterium]
MAELRHYRFVYRTDNELLKNVRRAIRRAKLDVRVLSYIGSNYTSGRRELRWVETPGHRDAVALVDVAVLTEPISTVDQTEISIRGEGPLPIHASTTRQSDPHDPKRFDFWIRIDDELMRVVSVGPRRRTLSVERGLDSPAAPHRAGATVLAPCYHGDRREGGLLQKRRRNGYPDAPSSGGSRYALSYALDPTAPEAIELLARRVGGHLRRGNDGVWIDNFKPAPNWMCNALGEKSSHPWNHAEGRRFTDAELTDALLDLLGVLRAKASHELGRSPYFAANGVAGIYDQPAGIRLFRSVDDPRGLDAFAFEDAFIKPLPFDRAEGRVEFRANAIKRYSSRVTALQDAARRALPAVAMTTAAGALGAFFTPELTNYAALDRFGWCSFLLTVAKQRTTYFGRPVVFRANGNVLFIPPLGEHYFLDIGNPREERPLDDYLVERDCYAREFDNAVVLVNTGSERRKVHLPDRLGRLVNLPVVELDGADGRILMKDASLARISQEIP